MAKRPADATDDRAVTPRSPPHALRGRAGAMIVAIILLVGIVVSMGVLDDPDHGRAFVLDDGAGSGQITVVVDGAASIEEWTISWDEPVSTFDHLGVDLVGDCRCRPRQPQDTGERVTNLVRRIWPLVALVAAVGYLVWKTRRRQQRAVAGSLGALDSTLPTLAVTLAPRWVQVGRGHQLWFELEQLDDARTSVGWLALGTAARGADPSGEFRLHGGWAPGLPVALTSADGHRTLLPAAPLASSAPGPVNPSSDAFAWLLGWERAGDPPPREVRPAAVAAAAHERRPAPELVAATVRVRSRVRRTAIATIMPSWLLFGFAMSGLVPSWAVVPAIVLFVVAVRSQQRWAPLVNRPFLRVLTEMVDLPPAEAVLAAQGFVLLGVGEDQPADRPAERRR